MKWSIEPKVICNKCGNEFDTNVGNKVVKCPQCACVLLFISRSLQTTETGERMWAWSNRPKSVGTHN